MTELGCAFVELLLRYFGRGALPDYSATPAIHDLDPYRPLRERLASMVDLHDSTDLNYDLGTSWWFSRGDVGLNLKLSYVGPFALLLRYPAWDVLAEDEVLDVVRAQGFSVVTHAQLEVPVRMWSPEVEGSLYEFLFEFDKGRPWDE
jgi:hypothetical protein